MMPVDPRAIYDTVMDAALAHEVITSPDEASDVEVLKLKRPVKSLKGIERFERLRVLRLPTVKPPSLLPLLGLDSLEWLYLLKKPSKLEPVARFTKLRWLTLESARNLKGLASDSLEWFCVGSSCSTLDDIGALSDLKGLDLQHNGVSSLAFTDRTPKLEVLDLSFTKVKDLAGIEKLSELRWLDLGGSKVRDLGPLAACTKLAHVGFGGTQVKSVQPLAGLPLKSLSLGRSKVMSLDPLDVGALDHLCVWNTKLVGTVEGLPVIETPAPEPGLYGTVPSMERPWPSP